MSAGMKMLGRMRPAASGKLMTGGALFMALGLVSCSSNVSRFDYPMFAASEQSSDANLTTASVNPVPAEPVYQSGPGYRDSTPGYDAPSDQTVMKSELPPPSGQPYRAPASRQPAYRPQPYAAPATPAAQPRPLGAQSYPQRVASVRQQPSPRPATAPAAKAPLPQPQAKQTVYHVKSGDTLAEIAREHDVSVADIMSANRMTNSRLSINEKLVIPGGHAGARTASSNASIDTVYHVRSGDTLSSIARKYDMDYHELARHNGIRETTTLSLGQAIKVPGGPGDAPAPVKVASRSDAVPVPEDKPSSAEAPPAPVKTRVAAKPRPKVQNASLPSPAPMTGNSFRWPVRGRVISGFGSKPNGKHNDGINVAVPLGTSVKASENGVVAYAGSELEGYGNLILIRHANGWVTAYAHNDEILVKRGDEVRRGQVISKAGKTGSVSQPQVHFELRKGSQPVDPLKHMANS